MQARGLDSSEEFGLGGVPQDGVPVHVPSPVDVAQSQMSQFSRHLAAKLARDLSSYRDLHRFSIDRMPLFWESFLKWSGMAWNGECEPACTSDRCEDATFFPNLRLNYAANLLARRPGFDEGGAAVTAIDAGGGRTTLSRERLRARVEAFARALVDHGLRPGDRVVAILRNDVEAVVTALAAAAAGAAFSSVAPEMGADAILDRFAPLEPKLLVAHVAPRPHDAGVPVAARVEAVARGLPTLATAITLDAGFPPRDDRVPFLSVGELVERSSRAAFEWLDFPFNHPLFTMFSSGTTGRPKCIVHGAGGTLLEHLKEHRLHCDLRPGDNVLFQTTCAWMMWNWQLSILATGAAIVLWDGPADPSTLWRVVADERVTVFGTSPAFLRMCEDAGVAPAGRFDLGSLRAILSTGSILHDDQYLWVRDRVGRLPLQSISGGTDILGCFLLGNPNAPVYAGESQCVGLGHDLRAIPAAGSGGVGELVCANPFPSRPLGFHGDPGDARFHAAYFAANPGVWTHGDLVEFTATGGARLHGRSDGVLKARGIRVGPAEIYRVLRGCPEIREAMAVEQHEPAEFATGRIVLLLVLNKGVELDAALQARLRRRLTERASAAHVPELMVQVAELPATYSGKQSEAAASDALNGRVVRNLSALRNPDCLEVLRNHPSLRPADPAAPSDRAAESSTEQRLQAMWEQLFGWPSIGWRDDFFELGGTSLLAVRLLAQIRTRMGRNLPLTSLHAAPTIEALAALIHGRAPTPSSRLVLLHPGEGAPLFLVHSILGTVTQLWGLGRAMRSRRPVYAIQASGVEPGEPVHRRVEDMAADYVEVVRTRQPAGPYLLGGFSFGGLVAFEMARQLERANEEVAFVGLVDTTVHRRFLPLAQLWRYARMAPGAVFRDPMIRRLRDAGLVRLGLAAERFARADAGDEADLPPSLRRTRAGISRALWNYRPGYYAGRVTLFRASVRGIADPLPIWRKVARGGVDVHPAPGDHFDMIYEPNVGELAGLLDRCVDAV